MTLDFGSRVVWAGQAPIRIFGQAFWEHFFFPYLTNTQGNKRGDLLNFVTMVHAFRKDNVCVEKNDEGKLTFRLESLAKANCLGRRQSHSGIYIRYFGRTTSIYSKWLVGWLLRF